MALRRSAAAGSSCGMIQDKETKRQGANASKCTKMRDSNSKHAERTHRSDAMILISLAHGVARSRHGLRSAPLFMGKHDDTNKSGSAYRSHGRESVEERAHPWTRVRSYEGNGATGSMHGNARICTHRYRNVRTEPTDVLNWPFSLCHKELDRVRSY